MMRLLLVGLLLGELLQPTIQAASNNSVVSGNNAGSSRSASTNPNWLPNFPAATDIWDQSQYDPRNGRWQEPEPGEVGPGTYYPIGLSPAEAKIWYRQAQAWLVTSQMQFNGIDVVDSPPAPPFNISINNNATIPAASQAVNGFSSSYYFQVWGGSASAYTYNGLVYPYFYFWMESGGVNFSTYRPDVLFAKPWPNPITIGDQSLTLLYDEPANYDSIEGGTGDHGNYSQTLIGTANIQPACISIVHPATGEEDPNLQKTNGGYVAIYKDNTTPVTQLHLPPGGSSSTQYILTWNTSKIQIWKNPAMTDIVASGQTTFPSNQDTYLYLKGIAKSDEIQDIEIDETVTTGSATSSPAPLKLTVVQAEFIVMLKMFIRDQWIPAPPIISSGILNPIAGGDDRDNVFGPNVSYRASQWAIVNPYRDLDTDGIKDQPVNPPAVGGGYTDARGNFPGTSKLYNKSTSVPDPNSLCTPSNRLLGTAIASKTGTPDVSQMSIDPYRTGDGNVAWVEMHGASSDPLVWGSFSIDWDLKVGIDASDPINPKCNVTGTRDNYPAFEVDVSGSNPNGIQPYVYLPNKPTDLSELTLGLSGNQKNSIGTISAQNIP